MLDEASRRRLAEMGIDVYLPRASTPAAGASATAVAAVYVLTDSCEHELPRALARTLAFAGVAAGIARAQDAELAGASALVVCGPEQARAVGARLDAAQQAAIGWVATGALQHLAGDALAKRALWGELKRLLRQLRAAHLMPGA